MITDLNYVDTELIIYIENNTLKFYKNTDNLYDKLHSSVYHNVKHAFISYIDNEFILTIHKLDDSVIQYDSQSKYYNSYYDVNQIIYTSTQGFYILFNNGYVNFTNNKIKTPEVIKRSYVKFISCCCTENIEGYFAQLQNSKLVYWGISNNKYFNFIYCMPNTIKSIYCNNSKIYIIFVDNTFVEYNNHYYKYNLHSNIKLILHDYEHILKLDNKYLLTSTGRLIDYISSYLICDYVLIYDGETIVDKDNNIIDIR